MRAAAAPVSFGVHGGTLGRPGLPDAASVLDAIADAGYAGTELGPAGFLGDGATLGPRLAERGLELAAAYVPLHLTRGDAFRRDLAELDATLDLFEHVAAGPGRPLVLLADYGDEPVRRALAGRIEAHREAWPGEGAMAMLAANVDRAAERCAARGFAVAFHPHVGTWIETPRELAALIERVDVDGVGLCFDTGHALVGGGDPRALLGEYAELVTHLHLKDVHREALAALLAAGADETRLFATPGLFCDLGAGDADVAGCLEALGAVGYDGWAVPEQDCEPGARGWLDAAAESARVDRAFLAAHGVEQ